jgi:hypothetical protein
LSTVRICPPSLKNIEAFRDWAYERTETVGIFVVSGREDFLIHLAGGMSLAARGFRQCGANTDEFPRADGSLLGEPSKGETACRA